MDSADFKRLIDYRATIHKSSQASHTRASYVASWKRFVAWCGRAGQCAFPTTSDTVILYITDVLVNGGKIRSARVYVSAINNAHRSARIPTPEATQIREFLECAQRLRCEKPTKKKALRIQDLRQICARLMESNRAPDVRARAIITLGVSTALRRSSIVALDIEDLRWVPEGVVIVVRRSKTDQMGKGRLIGVAPGRHPETDTIGALRSWLAVRGEKPGALFSRLNPPHQRLIPRRIAEVVKNAAASIGLDRREYAGHTMRRSFVTCALDAGVNELAVMRITAHASLGSLREYYEEGEGNLFKANANSMIGL